MKKINIRNDIQSLRGLSVILIFLFHFDQIFFRYLYVGVDIFFVISGYVITNSIINSIRGNNFDIFRYFLKRIKRIYPALIFFLIFFNILFFLFVSFNDGEYFEIIFSSISSFLGISNFYYIFTPNLDYFDDKIKWLQHTWSLSNEIQFYIIIGFIFFIFSKLVNKIKDSKIIITTLLLISVFSIVLFIFGNSKLLSDYYSSFSRFWEFFLGSIIYLIKFKKFKIKNISFDLLIIIFLITLFIFNFFIPNLSYKFVILFSVMFISLVILFSDKNNLSNLNNLFIYYGNLSFSFFLWHLPIISFLKIFSTNIMINFFSAFILTTIISHFSYKYIEIKYNKNHDYDKNFILLLKPLSLILLFSGILLFNNNIFLDKTRNFLYQNVIKFYPLVRAFNIPGIDDNINDNWILPFDKCRNKNENFSFSRGVNCINEEGNEYLFFIAGNSYGDHIVPAFSMLDNNLSIYKSRFENCYVINELNFKCNDKSKIIVDSFKNISKKYKQTYFIISLKGGNYSEKKLKKIFSQLPKQTNILINYPHPNVSTLNNLDLFKDYNTLKQQDFTKLKSLKKEFKIKIFDVYPFLCGNNDCDKAFYQTLFIDGSHFKISTNVKVSKNLSKFIFNDE